MRRIVLRIVFLSRCIQLPAFNSYGASESIVAYCRNIWQSEAGDAEMPVPSSELLAGNVPGIAAKT